MFTSSKNPQKVTQEELDMIRIKIEDMDSTEDKTFLLEKLYRHINAIDAELKGCQTNAHHDERYAELLQLKEDAQVIRHLILDFQLPSDHYGLFVRYPKGYEDLIYLKL